MIKKWLLLNYNGCSCGVTAQPDACKAVIAFPITGYVVNLNDSVKLVQVHLEDTALTKKQMGSLWCVFIAPKDTAL